MCGIVGCKLKRSLNSSDIEQMRKIRAGLSHRGPDGVGEFFDERNGLYLGHLRLSIIDLDARSAQPMKRDNLQIVFNGEIYNYLEIQKTLAADYKFETSGDTEVVLRAWQKYGAKCIDMFDGMFALALWDGENLTLATDHFGEKPLYLCENKDGVYFASEPRVLIEAFGLKFTPEGQDVSDFLFLGYVRPPNTGFKELSNIGPASLITIHSDGVLVKSKYWNPPEGYIGKGKPKPFKSKQIDQIRDLLCQSLERRLRADVTIGLFLSGGVDSTLVAALAAKELGVDLHTYTVSFPDGVDESKQAQRIANHFNLSHTIIDSSQDELWKSAPSHLADIYGVPNDNMTALAVYQMCKVAKPFLTVALSGLGGDEVFYGYNKYETLYKRDFFYVHGMVLSKIAGWGEKIIPHPKLKQMQDLLAGTPDDQYLRIKNDEMMHLMKGLAQKPEDVLSVSSDALIHRVRNYDLNMSMPQSYIPAIDRGSMRASIEVRTPFLSRDLLNYVSTLDQRSLIAFGQKNLTRTLLGRYMPLDLLFQGKQGFVFPASRYYRECEPSVPQIHGFDPVRLESIWQKKDHPKLQQLMVRLSILEHFYAE